MRKQVPNDSPEWQQVDHQVQVVTGKSSVKVISVYKYEETTQNITDNMIMKNGKEKTWIDATINITDFSKQYHRQVQDKQVPLEDLILYAGHVNIHRYSNQPYKIFTFLFCKLCLGTAATPTTMKVENCDSIMIAPQNQQAFQYNFFVKQHSQYQLKYEVSFTVSQDKQFKLSEFSCCNCENRTPAVYCSTEKLYFCEECCGDHHKTKLMQSHEMETIDRVNTLQNCKSHNQKYQLYCLKCEKYLCQQCIQKGIHAQGSDHVVKPIRYFYEQLNQNIDSLPKKPMQKVDILLQNLKVKRKEIQDNEREVKLQIQQAFKKCLKMLQQQIAIKYQLLDSNQIELTMLKDRIAWNQSFCVFQSNALKPIYFFKSQNTFQNFIKKIKVADFDTIMAIKPNLIYKGINFVGTIESMDKNKQLFKEFERQGGIKMKQVDRIDNKSPIKSSRVQNNGNLQLQKSSKLLVYDPNCQPPAKGELMAELSKCGLKFFQLKSK